MYKSTQSILLAVFAMLPFSTAYESRAEDPVLGKATTEPETILRDMRNAVTDMKVSVQKGDTLRPATLVKDAILHYNDPQRQIVDATMWVWTVDDLPVMTMKLERMGFPEPERRWLFNAGSCSLYPITVTWPFERMYKSKKVGMIFQPLEDSTKLSNSSSTNLHRLRQLSRKFSATMRGAAGADDKSEMRLLPTPLYRYASKSEHVIDGALFGLSATGTNPDAIIAIQWREEGTAGHWEFACMGTTDCGLQILHEGREVWQQPSLVGQGTTYDTWTWFFSGRIK